tara:strand:+ start:374 stop:643 length:270 start_codon:yes stop_codon:yes gene_type:complete
MKAKINIEVSRASQTQYVPQVKFPHIDPVAITKILIKRPIGDSEREMVNDVGDLKIIAMILLEPIIKKNINDNHAAGTCINIILKETPW